MEGLKVEHNRDLRETLTQFGTSYLRAVASQDGLSLFRAVNSEAPISAETGERFCGMRQVASCSFWRATSKNKIRRRSGSGHRFAAEQFLALVRGHIHFVALLGGVVPSGGQIERAVGQAVDTFLHGAVGLAESIPMQR